MGSICKVEADQATYSTQFKQKGYKGHEVTLTLIGKFEHLPRLRRPPLSDSWQNKWLVLDPEEGIEDGAYSNVSIFTAPFDEHSWGNLVQFDGWNDMKEECYEGCESIVFVQKDGTKISTKTDTVVSRGGYPSLKIDPKNPVVEIIITSSNLNKEEITKEAPKQLTLPEYIKFKDKKPRGFPAVYKRSLNYNECGEYVLLKGLLT